MDARRRNRRNRRNGTTALGRLLARLGRGELRPGPDGLLLVEGHRLPLRAALTVGDVVLHPRAGGLTGRPRLLAHERRHAEQYARWGLALLPAYGLAALVSWALIGDRASANPFERRAGLADGGYRPGP